jgi:hypothetical protein
MLSTHYERLTNAMSKLPSEVVQAELKSAAPIASDQTRLVVKGQKDVTNEPLPLGLSLENGSGDETVTVAGLASGAELSLGSALGPTQWRVSANDLDKTWVSAVADFVGAMQPTVKLYSATGQLLQTTALQLEWIGVNKKPVTIGKGTREMRLKLPLKGAGEKMARKPASTKAVRDPKRLDPAGQSAPPLPPDTGWRW